MIFVEICPNVSLRISTRNIFDHKIRSGLLAIENLNDVDRPSIVLSLAGSKALLGVIFLHSL
jgi:hypothetical protein